MWSACFPIKRVVGAAINALALCPASLYAQASLTGVGNLPGVVLSSESFGVSPDGGPVVGRGFALGPEAFRWTKDGGIVGLGKLPGGIFSYALATSTQGNVVVGYCALALGQQAFQWTPSGGMTALPLDVARGVSHDGSIIVGSVNSMAVRWTNESGVFELGDLPGGSVQSQATDISADGNAIVGSSTSEQGFEAFRWTPGEGMVGLRDLLGGPFSSVAFAISADGEVAVGQGRSEQGNEAFRWSIPTGMVGLGDLPGGTYESFATGVSGDGDVIVGLATDENGPEAFVWTPAGGMRRVWDVLIDQGIDPSADGWTSLDEARDVSADGTVIVGRGMHQGFMEGFVAVIDPEQICYADCDGDQSLSIDDFICYQTIFALSAAQADCDHNGSLNVDDFICFQTLFAIGC